MPKILDPPNKAELQGTLGAALPVWTGILGLAEAAHAPLTKTWKASKSEFGLMCLLQHKKRTLLYLTPDRDVVWVAIILGERAFHLAMARDLPGEIKQALLDAKPYAEGRGIRFALRAAEDLAAVATLLEAKTAPA